MIRVLQVFAEPLSFGGQESAMMNFYRAIDKTKYQFDFFTPFYADNEGMIEEIKELGGEVFYFNKPFETKLRKKYFTEELKEFLSNHKYEIVHINSGSTFALAHSAKIAKELGVKKVIVHSHASGVENLKHRIVRLLYDPYFVKYPDYCIGCSKLALDWKFPKNANGVVIYNGIDTKRFSYKEEVRNRIRKELGIENEFVLGSVGRLSKEKNSLFIIDVFKEVVLQKPDSYLLMVGTGPLEEEVEKRINEYGLKDRVIHFKKRNDINELMSAMDAFILPSLFEGFGLVLVEAQASGLPCVCSDTISKEIKITDQVTYLPLSDGATKWANVILENLHKRSSNSLNEEMDFDIKECVNKLEGVYNN